LLLADLGRIFAGLLVCRMYESRRADAVGSAAMSMGCWRRVRRGSPWAFMRSWRACAATSAVYATRLSAD